MPSSPKKAKSKARARASEAGNAETGNAAAAKAEMGGKAGKGDAGMSSVEGLLDVLDLEPAGEGRFRGHSPDDGWKRVFGGQVLAQALMAAIRTVPAERRVNSLHAYFLLGGNPKIPIDYEVERLRDGGSFSTRRVKASQAGKSIFALGASFHGRESGLDHGSPMPDVPPPEDLPSAKELFGKIADKLPANMQTYWQRERPIEMRPVDISRYIERKPRPPRQAMWLKTNGALADDPTLHECVLAYVSDFTLLDTALVAHGKLLFDSDMQLASLDHALWFHRPFRADEWLLYVQDSPSASGSRGFARGSIFTRQGTLVASVAQEGLMRQRSTSFLLE